MRPAILFTLNSGLFIAGLAVLISLRQDERTLRAQTTEAHARHVQIAALRAERDRLRATLPSEDELAVLRSDRDALPKLRAELDDLLARAEHRLLHPELEAAAPPNKKAINDPPLSRSEWINAGRENARDALITTLWALAHGDVNVLADLIALTPGAQAKLRAFLAHLPAHLQPQDVSPERMAALLAARDRVPSSIQILRIEENSHEDASWAGLRVRVTTAEGKEKTPTLIAFRHAQTDGWRLQIPDPIVDYYLENVQDLGKESDRDPR
jgi:hypothetical protein